MTVSLVNKELVKDAEGSGRGLIEDNIPEFFLQGLREIKKTSQIGSTVSGARLERWSCRIQSRGTNYTTATFGVTKN
jgi:hypothetical protein